MRPALCSVAFAALLLSFAPAAFAIHDWTGVPSTGAIDGSSLGFFTFNNATLTYLAGSTSLAPVIARYNVTNTFDNGGNPDMPLWTTLELGYSAAGLPAGAVRAILFQVNPCTGVQVTICSVNSLAGVVNTCGVCNFGAGTFDFSRFLYYIEVILTRPAPNLFPTANSLRLF